MNRRTFIGTTVGLGIGLSSGVKASENWPLADPPTNGTLTEATDVAWVTSFSPDSSYLAVGSWDDNVYIYNMSDWSLTETLVDATDSVYGLSFSSDSYFAVGSMDNNIYIYDTSNWVLQETLNFSESGVFGLSFSPNGNLLAAATGDVNQDQSVDVYDTSSNDTIDWILDQTIEDATSTLWSVSFSPDGEYLISGSGSGDAYVYDPVDYSLIQTLTDAGDVAHGLSYSPDSSIFTLASQDNNIYVYNTDTFSLQHTLEDATGSLYEVSFSPGGDYLASGSLDENVYLYDASSDDPTNWVVQETLGNATDRIYDVSFSPDYEYLVSGSNNDITYVYDANPLSNTVSGFFFNRWNPISLSVTGREATRNEEIQGEDISDEVSIEIRQ